MRKLFWPLVAAAWVLGVYWALRHRDRLHAARLRWWQRQMGAH